MKLAYLGIKLSEEDKQLLDEVANQRGEANSSFVRRAIRKELARLGYFDEDVRKALGV